MSKETGGSAFPTLDYITPDKLASNQNGMTLRQYAAIKLKVPDSGTDWLDAMITQSLKDDFAAKAMQSYWLDENLHPSVTNHQAAEWSYAMASAMIEARK